VGSRRPAARQHRPALVRECPPLMQFLEVSVRRMKGA